MIKKLILTITTLFLFVAFSTPALAVVVQPPDGEDLGCGIELPSDFVQVSGSPEPPLLAKIVCPFINLFNLIFVLAGVVFLIMIFITGIKYAMSQGDPKGLEGAKTTLTYTFIGVLVAAGAFTILKIMQGIFGLDVGILSPFRSLQDGIRGLLDFAGN